MDPAKPMYPARSMDPGPRTGAGRSPLGHEKGAFGHGKGAFGVRKGHTGNFEQGLGAIGLPTQKMLIFHWFYSGFA